MRLNYVCNIRHTAIACFEGVAIEDLVQGVIASKVLVHKRLTQVQQTKSTKN